MFTSSKKVSTSAFFFLTTMLVIFLSSWFAPANALTVLTQKEAAKTVTTPQNRTYKERNPLTPHGAVFCSLGSQADRKVSFSEKLFDTIPTEKHLFSVASQRGVHPRCVPIRAG
jgi:hypothetical protein